jgi:hypothetical protein
MPGHNLWLFVGKIMKRKAGLPTWSKLLVAACLLQSKSVIRTLESCAPRRAVAPDDQVSEKPTDLAEEHAAPSVIIGAAVSLGGRVGNSTPPRQVRFGNFVSVRRFAKDAT